MRFAAGVLPDGRGCQFVRYHREEGGLALTSHHSEARMLHRMHDTPLETCSTMRCIACAAQAVVSHILFCPGPHLVRNEG